MLRQSSPEMPPPGRTAALRLQRSRKRVELGIRINTSEFCLWTWNNSYLIGLELCDVSVLVIFMWPADN